MQPDVPLPNLELEVTSATRLTRSLWLALQGLLAQGCHPTDEDLRAVDELAWKAHEAASRVERRLYYGGGRNAATA